MGSDEVDPLEIAEDWTARIKRVLELSIRVRDEGKHSRAQFFEMHFQDFVHDQFAVVEKIYESFGLEMTDITADRMKAFIADNPKGKHGIHRYSPEEYGVEPERIRESFRPYMERFGIESESL
jgi:hypothetical protein